MVGDEVLEPREGAHRPEREGDVRVVGAVIDHDDAPQARNGLARHHAAPGLEVGDQRAQQRLVAAATARAVRTVGDGADHQHAGAQVRQRGRHLRGRERRVERRQHGAEPAQRVHERGVLGRVAQAGRHPVALAHAAGAEGVG